MVMILFVHVFFFIFGFLVLPTHSVGCCGKSKAPQPDSPLKPPERPKNSKEKEKDKSKSKGKENEKKSTKKPPSEKAKPAPAPPVKSEEKPKPTAKSDPPKPNPQQAEVKEKSLIIEKTQGSADTKSKSSKEAVKPANEAESPDKPAPPPPKEVPPVLSMERVLKKGLLDDYTTTIKPQRDNEIEAMELVESQQRQVNGNVKVTFNVKKCEIWETKQMDTVDDDVQEEDP